jgi:hypothetical protein
VAANCPSLIARTGRPVLLKQNKKSSKIFCGDCPVVHSASAPGAVVPIPSFQFDLQPWHGRRRATGEDAA